MCHYIVLSKIKNIPRIDLIEFYLYLTDSTRM